MFEKCENITSLDLNNFNTNLVSDMSYMFYMCIKLHSLNINSFNTSEVTDFKYMFSDCYDLNSIYINKFDASKATNMNHLFNNCKQLKYVDLNNIYTSSNLKDISYLFANCNSLESIILNNFITSNVENMNYTFYNCVKLSIIDLSKFDTSKVSAMSYMFYNCHQLVSIDLTSFNTSNVKTMSYMFSGCNKTSSLNLGHFDTSKVTNMAYMFSYNEELLSVDLSGFITSNVKTLSRMFIGCSKITSINLNNFDTSIVTQMNYMFRDCVSLKSLNLSSFRTPEVTTMALMFYNCSSLEFLDISNFRTNKVIEMSQMFNGCKSLISLDLTKFDTSSVTSMNNMFQNCLSLTFLNLSSFDTSKVTDMDYMFSGCGNITKLDLSKFDTSTVSKMDFMFNGCKSLTSLNLTGFNTKKVYNMSHMFKNCYSLSSLDLESFIVSKVKDMRSLFSNCNSLISLNINNFNASSITIPQNVSDCFYNCSSLKILYFNKFNESKNSLFREKMIEGINPNLVYCLNFRHDNSSNNSYNCSGICQSNIYGYEYNNTCYNSCPIRTNIISNISYLCEDLNCEKKSKYYNISQNECIDNVPDGYYVNDTILKTIDKCHSDCKTCNKNKTEYSTNCNSCLVDSKYLFMGNCVSSCNYGFFTENNNKKCICPISKCKECSLESYEINLCISCNLSNNYYPILNDNNNGSFIDCFNSSIEEEGYFLNKEINYYEKCYKTCKKCFGRGNDTYHNCSECNIDYKYMNDIYPNCYQNYSFYYYWDSENQLHSTSSYKCPLDYKLIEEKSLCIDNCSNDIYYKYEFNNNCYLTCPFNSSISDYNEYICECKYYYNNMTECIKEIPEGYYLKNIELKMIEKCDEKCQLCSNESIQNNLCISCNINKGYYPISIDYDINNSFINCYNNSPLGYYLENNTYKLNKRCEAFEIYEKIFNKYQSFNDILYSTYLSYFKCSYYYYCDSSNNFVCTSNNTCPYNYSKLIRNKKKCVDNCTNDSKYIYEYENECYDFQPYLENISYNYSYLSEDTKSENQSSCIPSNFFSGKCTLLFNGNNDSSAEAKDEMINNIEKGIMNGAMDDIIHSK